MEKKSKITRCVFKNEWQSPTGLLYVFEVTLENGDKGSVYLKTDNSDEIAVNNTINYTINEKNKITLIRKEEKTMDKNYFQARKFDAVGLAFSYAKDIIVAQINNKAKVEDITAELIKIAEPIAIKMNEIEKQLKSQE